jgi:hypothetical protein
MWKQWCLILEFFCVKRQAEGFPAQSRCLAAFKNLILKHPSGEKP